MHTPRADAQAGRSRSGWLDRPRPAAASPDLHVDAGMVLPQHRQERRKPVRRQCLEAADRHRAVALAGRVSDGCPSSSDSAGDSRAQSARCQVNLPGRAREVQPGSGGDEGFQMTRMHKTWSLMAGRKVGIRVAVPIESQPGGIPGLCRPGLRRCRPRDVNAAAQDRGCASSMTGTAGIGPARERIRRRKRAMPRPRANSPRTKSSLLLRRCEGLRLDVNLIFQFAHLRLKNLPF